MAEKSSLKPAYLICGTDHPKVRLAVARLRKRVFAETSSELNITLYDARVTPAADVVADAESPTFTLGTRLLLVSAADDWKAGERDLVAAWLADPLPGVCLALVGETFRKTERLYKLLEKGDQVLRYDLPKRQADVAVWARERARERGARLGVHEARHLVSQVGADPDLLEAEIVKLATYSAGEPVTAADIDAVCSPTVDARIYQLTDAVGRRDAHNAFRLLEGLYASGGKTAGEVARSTLYSLVRYVGQLMTVMDLPHEMPPNEVAATLGVKPFTAQKLLEQRDRFDRRSLERALAALADAQAQMVGKGELEPEFALELALSRVIASR